MKNMRKIKIIGLLAVISSLMVFSACKVTETYKTSDMNLHEEFRLPDSISNNLDDAIITWRDFFRDTLLGKLIDSAFEQNFDLRTANKEIAINNQFYKQSKAAFFPQLNLNLLNIEREWSSKNSRSSVEDDWYEGKGKTAPENL